MCVLTNGVVHGLSVQLKIRIRSARVQTQSETILFTNVCSRGLERFDHFKTNTDLSVPFVFFHDDGNVKMQPLRLYVILQFDKSKSVMLKIKNTMS